MSSYHKPKVFRSADGCCICKAKSSSSRFTDSSKYEDSFLQCFKLEDKSRFGEICNACVLIVKRWRMLPKDTKKNWHHVVDSRVGPGGSKVTFRNVKKKVEPVEEKFEKIRKKKVKVKKVIKPDLNLTDNDVSGFIDLTYFKRTVTCCGIIFVGLAGEVLIDERLFRRCQHHLSSSSASTSTSLILSSSSEASISHHPVMDKPSDELFEESDDTVDDTDSISFYSDDTIESVSKHNKDDFKNIVDTDGDEGFYDKSELKRHLV